MRKTTLFKKTPKINEEGLFDLYKQYKTVYEQNASKILSFETIISKPLLLNNLGFKSPEFKTIKHRLEKAVRERHNIQFKDFTIMFNLNLKYSKVTMVPLIASGEILSDNHVINFVSDEEDYAINNLLTAFNTEISELISRGFYLELIPNTLIFQGPDSLKLFFNQEVTSKVE